MQKSNWITPEIAKKYLDSNQDNFRVLNSARVDQYSKEMATGNWCMNGETVSFFENGLLNNGQHRLTAVIKAGVPVWFLVVRGIPNKAEGQDKPLPRSTAQVLAKKGIKCASVVAAAAKLAVVHDNGHWTQVGIGMQLFTDSQVRAYGVKYEKEIMSCIFHSSPLQKSISTAVAFLATGKRGLEASATAKWFFSSLASGRDISEKDPVYALRDRLIANQSASRKLSAFHIRMLVTVTWNQTCLGEVASSVYRFTGPSATKFPEKVLVARDLV